MTLSLHALCVDECTVVQTEYRRSKCRVLSIVVVLIIVQVRAIFRTTGTMLIMIQFLVIRDMAGK